jgi:polysaccharide pyruvyl transferase WcaK-like protein
VHIGVHNSANSNAGDTLLFPVVRRLFDCVLGPFNWELRQAWDEFNVGTAAQYSAAADAIVLGGGGLMLRDQAGSDTSNSGWQWNSTIAGVDAIDVPLIVFAIGYNRFRGQPEFDPVFFEHIRHVVQKAAFFGLRNNGSIRALKGYLSEPQAATLRHQYCPTTVVWQLYEALRNRAAAHDAKSSRVLAFNAAFDRASYRFGENTEAVLSNLGLAVAAAHRRGWQIINVAHKTMDRQIEPYLDKVNVDYVTVDLSEAGPDDILGLYAEVDFAFGMRGHAQLIPFGLRRPLLSIISHDKMRYFLEDLGRPDWGIEVDAPDIGERLLTALVRIEEGRRDAHWEIASLQDEVWRRTYDNMALIGSGQLGTAPRVTYDLRATG